MEINSINLKDNIRKERKKNHIKIWESRKGLEDNGIWIEVSDTLIW